MPLFDAMSLGTLFNPSKVRNLVAWFDELKVSAPVVAECIAHDAVPLGLMVPLLEELSNLYPGTPASDCIVGAIHALRSNTAVGNGLSDCVCRQGASIDLHDLKDSDRAYVTIRRRQLPDELVFRASARYGDTHLRDAATVRPLDWCKYCQVMDANPLVKWRGFVWLAPVEDVRDEIKNGGAYSADPAYWCCRHWLLVGIPWEFGTFSAVGDMLAGFDAKAVVVLYVESKDVTDARVPTILDAYPGRTVCDYCFRPRGWWIANGRTPDSHGLALDLWDNLAGSLKQTRAREAIVLIKDIVSIRELIPSANGEFSLLDNVRLS